MLLRVTFLVYTCLSLGFVSSLKAESNKTFATFTGKILGKNVRLRTAPDLNSHVIKQFSKDELVLVIGENADFWAVQPPVETKVYAYRTYILDNIVEADRVNVRLKPDTKSPVLGKLQKGTRVHGKLSKANNKWLEITPPSSVKFYIAKEYVAKAGGPQHFAKMMQRKQDVRNLLRNAVAESEAQCQKAFTMMDPKPSISKLEKVIHQYKDFPRLVEQAKVALAILKDNYTQKKITFLEDKTNRLESEKGNEEDPFAKFSTILKDERLANPKLRKPLNPKLWANKQTPKGPFNPTYRHWESVENTLFSSWAEFNEDKRIDDFYNEQKANAVILTGVIEKYENDVQNKPGNYLLKNDMFPVAYLYSTHVDLKDLEGKNVKVFVSPRPNNKFAFPAYFVLQAE